MTTYTDNEKSAIVALFKSCLSNMGGKCLEDLDDDPFTWVEASDLVEAGWNQKQAEGTFGSLVEKQAVFENDPGAYCIDHEDKELRAIFEASETPEAPAPIKLKGFDRPEPDAIDATPSFEGAVNMCLVVLENGTEEGKAMAREELLRYARELDRLAAQSGSAFDPSDTPMEGE
ncbi:hypothetical protein [uncultured Planktomarina sp.]|uniref:hypothetical protein n=1 Tax=uncultured Planktomarina sp. TaxID=1538529 RepID=UPI0032608607